METQVTKGSGGKCPACGSSNTHIYRRGYSLGFGLLAAVAFTFIFMIWQIIRTDYSNLTEAEQNGVVLGIMLQLFWPILIGLLCGLIGKNELRGKCLDCGKKFKV